MEKQENPNADLKGLKQAPGCEINSTVWISFSLNLEYIKFHIFILVWVCLCVSESPAVVRKIIFTPLVSLTLSQRKMDVRKCWRLKCCWLHPAGTVTGRVGGEQCLLLFLVVATRPGSWFFRGNQTIQINKVSRGKWSKGGGSKLTMQ